MLGAVPRCQAVPVTLSSRSEPAGDAWATAAFCRLWEKTSVRVGAGSTAVHIVCEVLFSLLFLLLSTQFCFAGDQDLLWQRGTPGGWLTAEVGVWVGEAAGERMEHKTFIFL